MQLALVLARVGEIAVVAGVALDRMRLGIEVQDARHRMIEKLAIMRNDQHRAAIAAHKAFQPLQRLHVEVVGRLIEQQQIRLAQQQRRQAQAGFLAAAERACERRRRKRA